MKNKWFDDVFIPSLFDRTGVNNPVWLSKNQTAVCVKNMHEHVTVYDVFAGSKFSSLWYSCEWNGREVLMNYSKRNGCGQITFGMNESERKESKIQHEIERNERESEKINFIRNHSKTRERHVKECKAKIDELKEQIKFCIEDIEEMEANGNISAANREKEYLAKCKAELEEKEVYLKKLTA